MVKHLIEGSNSDEILRIRYTRKADETWNLMKLKSNNWTLDQREIRKILHPNLGEMKNNSVSRMKLSM